MYQRQVKALCHCQHLHQSRGRLGVWVSRGNRPLIVITSSVSTYLRLSLMTPAPVTVCCHPPPLAPSIDVPVTSPYVCVFWTLLPLSIWHVVRLEDEVIMTSSWNRRSRTCLYLRATLVSWDTKSSLLVSEYTRYRLIFRECSTNTASTCSQSHRNPSITWV